MNNTSNNNNNNSKRIAKNTLALYIRMLLVIFVGLYTSRVILYALGIEDYGLFSVVGGVVSLFTFFRSSMEKCTQRFLNVEMTKLDEHLNETFNNALIIHIVIALVAIVLAETVGLWFLNTFIQIPDGRLFAANCVYQTVVGGLLLTIFSIPYSATIIAHEKMGVFALISIIECFINLGIAFLITYSTSDKLILYSLLLLIGKIIITLMYTIYCHRKFVEVTYNLKYNRVICKEMLGYTSWTLVGHAMILGTNQGNSILVNMFHGVTSNAAMAVANQVNSHVLHLTSNFQTAFNPQITKAYASEEYNYLNNLVISTSKISYFLLLVVSIPLLLNIDLILDVWLVEVPVQANMFCILMLSSGILQATTAPLNFSIMASGRIKWFQIITGIVFLSDLIILFVLFELGLPAITAMWVKLFIMLLVTIVRICFANHIIPTIKISLYLLDVVFPILLTTVICFSIALLLMRFTETVVGQLSVTFFLCFFSLFAVFFLGFSKRERNMIKSLINNIRKK